MMSCIIVHIIPLSKVMQHYKQKKIMMKNKGEKNKSETILNKKINKNFKFSQE